MNRRRIEKYCYLTRSVAATLLEVPAYILMPGNAISPDTGQFGQNYKPFEILGIQQIFICCSRQAAGEHVRFPPVRCGGL